MHLGRIIGTILISLAADSQAAEIPDAVKRSVNNRVDSGQAIGMVVGYTNLQGYDFYGYGKTRKIGGETPDKDTLFEVGAITNLFTAVLLADAVARNEVQYEDDISKHLPPSVKLETRKDMPIQVEQLATHYSGLPRMPENFRPQSRDNPYADYSARDMMEGLNNLRMRYEAGETFYYSNFGMGLLGHILSQAANLNYEELVKSRMTRPLKLPDTTITLNDDQEKRFAVGHYSGIPVPNWDMPALAGAGALRSTARDLIRFLEVNLGFHDVLFMDSILETHRSRGEAHTESVDVGLGWLIMSRMNDAEIYWHNGYTGGYQSFVAFTKDPLQAVVVLTNSSTVDINDIALHLMNDDIPLREDDVPTGTR